MLKARLQPRVRAGPAPSIPPAAPSPPLPQNPEALTAGARGARVPLRAARRPAGGEEGRAALSLPALRLQQPARLPRAPPRTPPAPPRPAARPGPRLPRQGRGSPAGAAWARGEGPAAASSSPALRDGGRRPWRALPGAAPVAVPEPVPEASGPRGGLAPPTVQLIVSSAVPVSFLSVNNCKGWISRVLQSQ